MRRRRSPLPLLPAAPRRSGTIIKAQTAYRNRKSTHDPQKQRSPRLRSIRLAEGIPVAKRTLEMAPCAVHGPEEHSTQHAVHEPHCQAGNQPREISVLQEVTTPVTRPSILRPACGCAMARRVWLAHDGGLGTLPPPHHRLKKPPLPPHHL